MTKLIRIPQRFLDDHSERDLDTPQIVRASRSSYFIRSDDPALSELLSDAAYYADSAAYMDRAYFGLCMSAKATHKAIKAAIG